MSNPGIVTKPFTNAPLQTRPDEARMVLRSPILSIIHVDIKLNGIPTKLGAVMNKSMPDTVVLK